MYLFTNVTKKKTDGAPPHLEILTSPQMLATPTLKGNVNFFISVYLPCKYFLG